MPALVRGSFAALAAILVAAGTVLAFGADIFPWELRSETSVIFGFIYSARRSSSPMDSSNRGGPTPPPSWWDSWPMTSS